MRNFAPFFTKPWIYGLVFGHTENNVRKTENFLYVIIVKLFQVGCCRRWGEGRLQVVSGPPHTLGHRSLFQAPDLQPHAWQLSRYQNYQPFCFCETQLLPFNVWPLILDNRVYRQTCEEQTEEGGSWLVDALVMWSLRDDELAEATSCLNGKDSFCLLDALNAFLYKHISQTFVDFF